MASTTGTPTPPVVPADRPLAKLQPTDVNTLSDFADGLMYDGFNPMHTRNIVAKQIPAKDLIKLLVIASMIGNNPDRLQLNIKDSARGKEAMKLISTYRILQRANGRDDLTLPRLATAFAPLFVAVRTSIKDKLQNQSFGIQLDKVWQSPSLACFSGKVDGLHLWLIEFGNRIKQAKETDEQATTRTELFITIAIQNSLDDPFMSVDNAKKSIADLCAMIYG